METLQHMEIICIYFIYLLIVHILHTDAISYSTPIDEDVSIRHVNIIDIWFAVIDSCVAAAAAASAAATRPDIWFAVIDSCDRPPTT